ncbi:MAG: hypothetical protein ACK53I_14895 [Phenylobacterium sp.]
MTVRVLVLITALVAATPALAEEAPVATASTTPAPAMSTADQIDAWLRSSPALMAPDLNAEPRNMAFDDRKLHGEVTVGVGTRGQRHLSMRATAPVGESGRVSVAFGETRGPGWRVDPRCDLEAMTPSRPLDRIGGPNGVCQPD